MPTLLYFGSDKRRYYGQEAILRYVERGLDGRLIQSIKRYLPSPYFDHTVIWGVRHSLPELVAGFLERLRGIAEAEVGEGIDRVLMGRPVRFHEDGKRDVLAQQRLEEAARQAGFQDVRFSYEPIAAARAFERDLDRETLCLVGDLGGGTSDFTVMRLGPGRSGRRDRSEDILGSEGVRVGGNDFDAALVRLRVLPALGLNARHRPMGRWVPVPTSLHQAVLGWHLLSFAATPEAMESLDRWIRSSDDPDGLRRLRILLDSGGGYALFQAVEAAKIALSKGDSTRLRFSLDGLELDEGVRRGEFEAACAPLLRSLEHSMDTLLQRLGLDYGAIDAAFLTGGTSLIPCVRDLFERRFSGRILDQDTFTSVGLGLGVEAAEIWG